MPKDPAMILRSTMLVLAAACSFGCGPSSSKACASCEGQDLIDCEETYELCKDVKGCHKRYVRADYENGLCTSPTMDQACDKCRLDEWEACREEYQACEATDACTDPMRQMIRTHYALGLCASDPVD